MRIISWLKLTPSDSAWSWQKEEILKQIKTFMLILIMGCFVSLFSLEGVTEKTDPKYGYFPKWHWLDTGKKIVWFLTLLRCRLSGSLILQSWDYMKKLLSINWLGIWKHLNLSNLSSFLGSPIISPWGKKKM